MNNFEELTHIAYTDESKHNIERYRSISMISLRYQDVKDFHEELEAVLKESNVSELKWNKLKNGKMRHGAIKLIDFAIREMVRGNIRTDVLIWDTQDKRHDIYGRDDAENLERMYYHILRWVLTEKWGDKTKWAIRPDEHSSIDWNKLEEFLEYKRISFGDNDLFQKVNYLREHYEIQVIRECQSVERPLVQLADLFAGIGQHSWNDFDTYRNWERKKSAQMHFEEIINDSKITNKKQEQWTVIDYLKKECDNKLWGVSLKSAKGLWTRNPLIGPVNFWLYVPQHIKDTAPIKTRKQSF